MSFSPSLVAFVAKWQSSMLTERSAAQSHFIELCHVLGQPAPSSDPTGDFYTFEKGVKKTTGGEGYADVWMRGHFAWEYKGKRKSLADTYQQLLQYREDLDNPPLLVVCDLDRFEVHTNFTNTAKRVYPFKLADLTDPTPLPDTDLSALAVLRAIFEQPDRLRPQQTSAQVTEEAARQFARLAESLRASGVAPEKGAHFLMRLLFCLFAEDIGVLPAGLFAKLVEATKARPADFARQLGLLFGAMVTGGWFGYETIPHFDGGLFADSEALNLTREDLEVLARACKLDWASVEPAIFGTLFERSLDPSKRVQTGAHYTSREDILLVVEPVLMAPLRREWAEVQNQAQEITAKRDACKGQARRNREDALRKLLVGFATRVASVQVLDPACGSGNFLYVALKLLMDLEKEVITFAAKSGLPYPIPQVEPKQLHGIEINAYAHELAQVVVWIGYIQWLHDNGFGMPAHPILKPLDNIKRMDAILAYDDEGRPVEPGWPDADIIVGNPPFLGGKLLRRQLGDKYIDALFALYSGRVPREADLVCYWFERARALIASGRVGRAGLLATNSIRQQQNRPALDRIKETGDVFMAWSDRPWILEGAAVRVSMVGFDNGSEKTRVLDGTPAVDINADLTGSVNLMMARRLRENLNVAYMGDTKGGAFDIPADVAAKMLTAPLNPNGRQNSDVVLPWLNGLDITRRPRGMFIIDFGVDMSEAEAALYEAPFEYVVKHVKPAREKSRTTRREWWLHERPRPEMRSALSTLARYAATVIVAKHRLFVWCRREWLSDHRLFVFARDDDYFLGVVHSKAHEVWALRMGSTLEDRPSYSSVTCFETFPFPWPLGSEPTGDPRVEAIAQAARELVQKRDAWVNPASASEAALKKRTLTNLYNERPTWLELAHGRLDNAVFDAYGWPHDLSDEDILARLLALNLERAATPGGTVTSGDGKAES